MSLKPGSQPAGAVPSSALGSGPSSPPPSVPRPAGRRPPEAPRVKPDALPDRARMYVGAQDLPAPTSGFKTLEVETVKLAESIDPRKQQTELSLGRVRRSAPPPVTPEGDAPPSSARPFAQPSPAAIQVLLLLAAAGLGFVMGRLSVSREPAALNGALGAAQIAGTTPEPASRARLPSSVAPPAVLRVPVPASLPVRSGATDPLPAATASSAAEQAAAAAKAAAARKKSARIKPAAPVAAESTAPPSESVEVPAKRAIY